MGDDNPRGDQLVDEPRGRLIRHRFRPGHGPHGQIAAAAGRRCRFVHGHGERAQETRQGVDFRLA
jgi:hypothetical protein